ncbi:DMT family transporter [Micromonospora sp. U21]|uniref:DMT family transporter n=1 Tax=Micromonospora sp. U21 TaxID=2824899 RepID=UPI0027DB7DC3|nr:DMT family transporter [Micromonospora sp. U21]
MLLWGSAFVAIRHVGVEFSAGPLALARLFTAGVVLGIVVLLRRPGVWPARRAWLKVIVVGLTWFAFYNFALNWAEQRIDAGTAAMLIGSGPIFIAVLAGAVLGEGFPRTLVTGTIVALIGMLLIAAATSTEARTDLLAVLMCLGAAAAYAIAATVQKPLLAQASALNVTLLTVLVGAAACMPFAPDLIHEVQAAKATTVGWLIFLGVGPTALGFTTWAYALARSPAGRLSVATHLVTPVAAIMSWALLNQTPPILTLVGGALCLVGVYISRRKAR